MLHEPFFSPSLEPFEIRMSKNLHKFPSHLHPRLSYERECWQMQVAFDIFPIWVKQNWKFPSYSREKNCTHSIKPIGCPVLHVEDKFEVENLYLCDSEEITIRSRIYCLKLMHQLNEFKNESNIKAKEREVHKWGTFPLLVWPLKMILVVCDKPFCILFKSCIDRSIINKGVGLFQSNIEMDWT